MQVNGGALRDLRFRAGETIAELGRRCVPPIDPTVISRLENGKRRGTPAQIKALADAYQVSIYDIAGERVA